MRPPRPTLADVAKRAGVSTMTVSRVVNHDQRVSRATRTAVEAAIAALQYVPNVAARTLARGEIQRVCLLYGNPSAAYLGTLLLGALEATSKARVNLIVQQISDPVDKTSLAERFRQDWDALLIPPPMSDDPIIQETVLQNEIPATFISTGAPPRSRVSVGIDDKAAARDMTQHLIELGHSQIGFIRGNPDQTVTDLRYRGYRDALSSAGLEETPGWIARGLFTYQSGLEAGMAMLSLPAKPTAIFASNDDMASGVIAAAARLGLTVPTDLSVAGFDDLPIASTLWPALTTIQQPISEITARAVAALTAPSPRDSESSAEVSDSRHQIVPHHLIKRGSTAPPTK
ncbi:MAG: LacI family DNA-binding transcriptional regulator [Pseudomonadota bacterium]